MPSHCRSVLQSSTYPCCLHSCSKYSLGLPHPAVLKHLPPWCLCSLLSLCSDLIENSGSADIWAALWYAFSRYPPFLPPLSKSCWRSRVLSLHCVLSTTESRKQFLICPKFVLWHMSKCVIFICVSHAFLRHEIQSGASVFNLAHFFWFNVRCPLNPGGLKAWRCALLLPKLLYV